MSPLTVLVSLLGVHVHAHWMPAMSKRSSPTSQTCSAIDMLLHSRAYGEVTLNVIDAIESDEKEVTPIGPFLPFDMNMLNQHVSTALLEETRLTRGASIVTLIGKDIECTHSLDSDAKLHDKAICPYYWGVDYNPKRLVFNPSTLMND